jgi:UDP-N-acetylglucosamine diphosphorylase / glucose-1-phosphate thymidylyltransferase / UDP-N-acetylgalactosamine diphosphorylase / glucosamine-1-phosphate N-acetyltransferase / galactosamine-1-phosphate N-acetyltransferase
MIVVLPMAGRGSRFDGHGYAEPKPLIPVQGVPMFVKSLESLAACTYSRLVIVAQRQHELEFGISKLVEEFQLPNTSLVLIDGVTKGQLCTVLAAKEFLDTDEGVLIMGSDTIVRSEIGADIKHKASDCKGIISVANMPGDRWSFAAVDDDGRVCAVAEKERISPHASTGMYYFSNAREFVRYSEEMIANKETTRGEYYVIPVYQKMIARGERVNISQATEMWDLGTPESLKDYLSHHRD